MGCMNSLCGASSTIEWKQGWPLRSGGFAHLCDKCGSAYEQSVFCEVFHSTESGWRECASCGKRLHCGCVVSRSLLELLDGGSGVKCIGCAKSSGIHMANGVSTIKLSEFQHLSPLRNHSDGSGFRHLLQPQNENTIGLFHKMKQEDVPGEAGTPYFLNLNPCSIGPSEATKADFQRAEIYDDSLPHTNLTMTLGSSLGHSNPFPGAMLDDREHGKQPSLFLQGARSRHVLPKPPRSNLAPSVDTNTGMVVSQVRVARPPAEGRGRNQLLPRYWPRITDQELQQISGDSNSTIVPLFEKMLSASDAGRIGRLVLPKACAEAYFPPISQPEGLPLKIQDVKGKEWVFQFRFWPNNNSRMYVLEGVTPCIQSMQLQAGDTVTFSRMDPEGKLIMGFRKASTSVVMQDTHQSAIHNGAHSTETLFSGVFENLPIISGYSGLLQSLKGNSEPQLSALSKHLSSTSADISWHKIERTEGKTKEGFAMPSPFLGPEKKRSRNIGSKIKRLHIDTQDALEIRITWEEAQDLLRPPPSIKPSTVIIDDHEFEEYEEPPVFGKRGIFIVRITGEQEQWSQCDGCSKWRKLPVDVLLPDKWTCADNAWDPSRNSCSVPDELSPQELESLLKMNKEFKRQRTVSSQMPTPETESPGLDALANAAMLGDSTSAAAGATLSVATTTKHPRHRPGCSCIVCIQPPSGKGKHKPSCTCNVCMTVKRRFKTLMLNKKKRQSEREAEIASKSGVKTCWGIEMEAESVSRHVSLSQLEPSDNEARSSANELEAETAKEAVLDLNCDPGRDNGGESRGGTSTSCHRVSLVSLVRDANRPLEDYLKQNGLASLVLQEQEQEQEQQQQQQQQQSSSPTQMTVQVADESETQPNEEQPNGVEPNDQCQIDPQ